MKKVIKSGGIRYFSASHAGNAGSNPAGITMLRLQLRMAGQIKESLTSGSFFIGQDVPLSNGIAVGVTSTANSGFPKGVSLNIR